MNTLSWLMYFADVFPRFGDLIRFFGSLGIVFSLIGLVSCAVGKAAAVQGGSANDIKGWSLILNYSRNFFIGFSLLVVVGLLIPSTKTFYLIAASQTGEQVVQTEEFKKLRILLNEKLDEITKKEINDKND